MEKKFIPWGFIETGRGLTAVTTHKQRQRHAQLGEAAIHLLGLLGVSEQWLEEITDSHYPLQRLEELRRRPAPTTVSNTITIGET